MSAKNGSWSELQKPFEQEPFNQEQLDNAAYFLQSIKVMVESPYFDQD